MRGRLYRSRTDRVLGGVAGGIGYYFGIDPTIIRLVWVLLTLWGGAGVVLYFIAWIIIPPKPGGGYEAAASEHWSSGPRRIRNTDEDKRTLGWLLVIGGSVLLVLKTPLLGMLFSPAVLIGGGLLVWGLVIVGKDKRR